MTGLDDAADDGDVAYEILTRFSSSDSLYSVNKPVLKGTKGKNHLTGTESNDTILGLGGNDRLAAKVETSFEAERTPICLS